MFNDRESGEASAEATNAASLCAEATKPVKLAVWELSLASGALRMSAQWSAMLGLAPQPMRTTLKDLRRLVHPEDRQRVREHHDALLERRSAQSECEFRVRRADKTWLPVLASATLVADEHSGALTRAAGTITDLTSVRAMQQAAHFSEQRLRDIIDAADEYVWEIDREGCFTFVSQRVRDVLGYEPSEMIGCKPTQFMPPGEAERTRRWMAGRTYREGGFRDYEHQNLTKSGEIVWQSVSAVPYFDEEGEFRGYRGTSANVTARKQAESRLRRFAAQDGLTGLPNRSTLQQRLAQEIRLSARAERSFALLFIDLDRFKGVNETLGHAVGDALLCDVAQRLRKCTNGGDFVARLGGDEFVICLFEIGQTDRAGGVARAVLQQLSRPFNIAGHALSTAASIGIAVFPDDGADAATLLKHGDVAMYHAKQLGRNRYEFYTPELNLGALERLQLENELRAALAEEQFLLHYQPRLGRDGTVKCVEALLRWQHPTRGLLAADKFIGVAEDMGLISDIGQWVLATACKEMKDGELGEAQIKLAVNLSPAELRGREDFAATVAKVLRTSQFDPAKLEFEITETSLLHPSEGDLAVLQECRALGIEFAIDDFGTGYSNLSCLQQLPVQTLKIDRSFVANAAHRPIVEAILSITQKFKLHCVAEGIETQTQFADMCQLGCSQLQGYYVAAPVPARTLGRCLADISARLHSAGLTTCPPLP